MILENSGDDTGELRRRYWRTQEMNEMVKEGSKLLRCISLPNTSYIYEGGG